MKKFRTLKFILVFLLSCTACNYLIFAQVVITRQLPSSGVKQGTATWSEPYPDSKIVRETGSAEFKGRISAGGRAGQDKYGEPMYNVATDSYVTMIQPLRGGSLLSIDAKLLRLQSSVKEDQNYNGTISLEFEQFQIETAGGFNQTLSETLDVNRDDTDWWVSAAVSSGILETLPMSLNYQSTWIDRSEDTSQTDSKRIDELKFKSVGTVSEVGVELDAGLDYEDDLEEQSDNLGASGNIKITFPFGQSLGLQLNAIPIYSQSENSINNSNSMSLESGIGLNWFLNEEFQARIKGGRIDAWSEDSEIENNLYQNSWKAGLGLDYQPLEGFFAGTSYTFTKAGEGNWTHNILLPAGWLGQGAIQKFYVKGASNLIRTDTGSRVKDGVDWMINAALFPMENMNFNGDYKGGYLWQEGEESWNHKMSIDFSHFPDPLLNYRGGYALSNNQEDETEDLWTQQYLVGFTVKPMINFNVLTIDLSETLNLSAGASGDDALSSALLNVAIPLGSEFSTRVGVQWEWMKRVSVDGGSGNYMHYFTGFSVAGNSAPFSMTADYAFAHGYRGLRHDINSVIKVPFCEGYAIETIFNLNNYDENGQSRLYWLLGLNLVYEF